MTKLKKALISLFIILICVSSVLNFNAVYASPTYEDFTTYTEVDPNSHIAKTANHIDFQDYRNEDEGAYLYKDKGADHFTNFTHLLDFKPVLDYTTHLGSIWVLANDIDDVYGLRTGGKTAITVYIYNHGGSNYLGLQEEYAGSPYSSSEYAVTTGTWYYLKIVKAGTQLTLYVYSDAARTNLLVTLGPLTLHGNWSFRYIYAADSWNTNNAIYGEEYIDNLDLQEVTKAWNTAETWKLNLHNFSWFLGEAWFLNLHNYTWFTGENWKIDLHNFTWFLSEVWNIAVKSGHWFHAEIWQFLINQAISKGFDLPAIFVIAFLVLAFFVIPAMILLLRRKR